MTLKAASGSRISIYLPNRVYEQARCMNLNISRLCRKALEAEFKKRRMASLEAIDQAYLNRMPVW